MNKRFLLAVVAIMMAATPMALAQPKGARPGKPDAEKSAEAEKPAPELKVTPGMLSALSFSNIAPVTSAA